MGKKGITKIHAPSSMLSEPYRRILSPLLKKISKLRNQAVSVEDRLSAMVMDNSDVTGMMTIPGMNMYSSSPIIEVIDDIA